MTRTRSRTDKDQQQQPQASGTTPGQQWVGGEGHTSNNAIGGTSGGHRYDRGEFSIRSWSTETGV